MDLYIEEKYATNSEKSNISLNISGLSCFNQIKTYLFIAFFVCAFYVLYMCKSFAWYDRVLKDQNVQLKSWAHLQNTIVKVKRTFSLSLFPRVSLSLTINFWSAKNKILVKYCSTTKDCKSPSRRKKKYELTKSCGEKSGLKKSTRKERQANPDLLGNGEK